MSSPVFFVFVSWISTMPYSTLAEGECRKMIFFWIPTNGILTLLKAAKYEIQKPSTCCATFLIASFGRCFPFLHLAWSTCRGTKAFVAGWRKLMRKVEQGSTLSKKFWLRCSFFSKLTSVSRNKFAHVAVQVEGFLYPVFHRKSPRNL